MQFCTRSELSKLKSVLKIISKIHDLSKSIMANQLAIFHNGSDNDQDSQHHEEVEWITDRNYKSNFYQQFFVPENTN